MTIRTAPGPPGGTRRAVVRVASVPSGHVYVRHLGALDDQTPAASPEVVRLPDPTRPWWPPSVLDPAWLVAHADEFDVVHVHFGFDALSPHSLTEIVRTLHEIGTPLVLTVHDLRNPHHATRELHDRQLDVLVPAAAALITLTAGAAAEIARRWGRRAVVAPHPHVVELDRLRRSESHDRRPTDPDRPFVVGVHLKSLRACMSGPPVVRALNQIVAADPRLALRIDAHTDVATSDGARYDTDLAAALEEARVAGADVRVHDYFTDDELWTYLGSLDLTVLPYRFGTHSGWLEACRDLGTAVAAPTCGYYADQGATVSFSLDEHGLDSGSLADAVEQARALGAVAPVPVAEREAQRRALAELHAAVYAEVLT